MHVISNGVAQEFKKSDSPDLRDNGVFRIIVMGRLSGEKGQDIIIKAVSLCRNKDKIDLCFAGQGPREKYYRALSKKLGVKADFIGAYGKEQIIERIYGSHLYVHAAEIEVEGITCIEAFSCGRVPVISDSPLAATKQFAIDRKSIFKSKDPSSLAERIDYFIDNPGERLKLEELYAERGKLYALSFSIQKCNEMFSQAIVDHKTLFQHAETAQGKWMRRFAKRRGRVGRFIYGLLYFGFATPALLAFNKVFFGLKIEGRKNLGKLGNTGAVTVSNHVHTMDATMNAIAAFPKKVVFTGVRANMDMPVAGVFVKLFGLVPVPVTLSEHNVFFFELVKRLQAGEFVHIYPEGELIKYCDKLRKFKRGAFHLAVSARVPVLPLIISYRERSGKNGKAKKPFMTVSIGEPVYPDLRLLSRDAEGKLQEQVEEQMKGMFKSQQPFDEENGCSD